MASVYLQLLTIENMMSWYDTENVDLSTLSNTKDKWEFFFFTTISSETEIKSQCGK